MDKEKEKDEVPQASDKSESGISGKSSPSEEQVPKSNQRKAIGLRLLAFVGFIGAAVLSMYLDYTEKLPRSILISRIGILICFFGMEVFLNLDFLNFRRSFTERRKDWLPLLSSFVRLVAIFLLIITYLPSPSIGENIDRIKEMHGSVQNAPEPQIQESPTNSELSLANVSTVSVLPPSLPTLNHVSMPNPTNPPTPINKSTPTNTPTPTSTLIPTSTPDPALLKYKVGVLDQNDNCGDKDRNLGIIEDLKNLGFTVSEVANNLSKYDGFDVLYLPYGWSCSADSYDLVGIRSFLNRTGTGLLIGDPKPNPAFTVDSPYLFKLFGAFTFEFYDLTPSVVNAQSAGVVFQPDDDFSDIEKIFENIPVGDRPKAETNLEIRGESGFGHVSETHRRVLYRNNTITNHEITCMLSSYEKNNIGNIHIPRYIIMPGGERKGEDNQSNEISKLLMIDIIKWLAHDL